MLRFDLPSIATRNRPALARARKRIILPAIQPTATMAGDLARIYLKITRAWAEGANRVLLPAYKAALARQAAFQASAPVVMDDAPLAQVITGFADDYMDQLMEAVFGDASDWIKYVEAWQRTHWNSAMKPSGVSASSLIGPSDVQQTLQAYLHENTSLIRNISETIRRKIEGILFNGFTQRQPAEQVARDIQEAVGMQRQRALRIASDQTQKLSSALDTERFRQAGITEFEWLHSGKLHPRPWHLERNGQIFALEGEIDPDDMPGVPPFCGCVKRAVLTL